MSSMHASDLRKQLADFDAALAVLLKLPWGREQVARRCELKFRFRERKRPAVVFGEFWLVVERVDVRNSAVHEEKRDALALAGW